MELKQCKSEISYCCLSLISFKKFFNVPSATVASVAISANVTKGLNTLIGDSPPSLSFSLGFSEFKDLCRSSSFISSITTAMAAPPIVLGFLLHNLIKEANSEKVRNNQIKSNLHGTERGHPCFIHFDGSFFNFKWLIKIGNNISYHVFRICCLIVHIYGCFD